MLRNFFFEINEARVLKTYKNLKKNSKRKVGTFLLIPPPPPLPTDLTPHTAFNFNSPPPH